MCFSFALVENVLYLQHFTWKQKKMQKLGHWKSRDKKECQQKIRKIISVWCLTTKCIREH
jgi:hypothetical protein